MATTDGGVDHDGGSRLQPITVLHIDDDVDLLETTAAYLPSRHEDLTVESVTDPSEALDRIDTGTVECVLSDYAMPGMDGLELLAAVRSVHTQLPFVLYTGRGSEEIASEAIAAGVTEYIRKGHGTSHYDLLGNRIRNATRTYRAQRRADRLEHVTRVIRAINQALLRADSRQDLFDEATSTLASADPYVAAVIATGGDRLEPESWAGPLETPHLKNDPAVTELAREAISTRTGQVRQRITTDCLAEGSTASDEQGHSAAAEVRDRSAAAIPLVTEQAVFGVLVVYGEGTNAFDAEERGLLEEVAADIGFAVEAMRLREQLEQHATELELLTRVLRHDVRNDVQLVSGWCALLAEDVSPAQREYVTKIERTSRHVEELTDTAREIVEALATNGDHVLEPLRVETVLAAEVDKVQMAAEVARITLQTDVDRPRVLADEMLASVFRNVLNNAVQHTDASDPRIDVTLTERDGHVRVRIADDGPGIPEHRRETVFGKGERGLDSSGTGMGLYLVQTLVGQYDGSVWIEDNDPGAVVVIDLPKI